MGTGRTGARVAGGWADVRGREVTDILGVNAVRVIKGDERVCVVTDTRELLLEESEEIVVRES